MSAEVRLKLKYLQGIYPLFSFIILYYPFLSFLILYHPLLSFLILYYPLLSFIILYGCHFLLHLVAFTGAQHSPTPSPGDSSSQPSGCSWRGVIENDAFSYLCRTLATALLLVHSVSRLVELDPIWLHWCCWVALELSNFLSHRLQKLSEYELQVISVQGKSAKVHLKTHMHKYDNHIDVTVES